MDKNDYDGWFVNPLDISELFHRAEVDLHSDFMDLYPLISSPMAGISGSDLVIEMGKNNCLGILHRFQEWYEFRVDEIHTVANNNVPFGVAIGLENWEFELKIAELAVNRGAVLICCDVANGYMTRLKDAGKQLRNLFPNTKLMCGNVVDQIGAKHLRDSGFDFVRCGIGIGSLCSTRIKTGIGRNQLAAIKDCTHVSDVYIVSDGGISIPANAVKSFAVGADFCMIGRKLAFAKEAENAGVIGGMASAWNLKNTGKETKSVEGIEEEIDNGKKVPLKEILDDFLWGIRSACTYLNCKSYKDIYFNSKLVRVDEEL